jgi:aldehyde dehydrogenase (NAD+)
MSINRMDFTSLLNQQREFFQSRATRPVEFRADALRRFADAIEKRESEIFSALHKDLRKPPQEAYSAEIGFVQAEIEHALRHVEKWVKPQRRSAPKVAWPARADMVPEPRGMALIMGPWNYPLQLVLSPLVGALAAGCCAVIKPSELVPFTAEIIEKIIKDAFEERHVAVVRGDRTACQALLAQRFDSIFFTGSAPVGREVMAAASKFLTPVTLELGGKCPCIVCDDAALEVTARRIVWGKFMNAGQTCVAPDHVLVSRTMRDPLIAAMKTAMASFYPAGPRQSPDYARIINRRHFDRLVGYLGDGTIAHGGQNDADDLFIAPTILTDVSPDTPVMTEEIFGPILPIMDVHDVDEAFRSLRGKPDPLSAYIFTKDRTIQRRAAAEVRSGGMCINDVVLHLAGKDYPFGGLGESGMGTYHGKASFDVFTHFKPVLRCSTAIDMRFRYPPARLSLKTFKRIFRFLLK